MVWALALAYGFINVLDNPSRQSFVMEMAGPDDLANAVALNSVIVNVSRIIGPAVAGVLIATVGLSWAFLANAVSFAAVIAALYAMRTTELHRRPPVGRAKGQIQAGLRYAWHAWELRVPLVMMAVIGTLAYNFSVILPLYAHDVFHRGAGTYSALTVAMGVGALAGGLTIAARRRPSHRLLVVVSLAFGVFILAVAAAPTLPVCLAMLVLMGAASIMFIATANSLLQLNSSSAMRGRVMALWAMVFLGSTPIGAPLIGFWPATTARASRCASAASRPCWWPSGPASSCAASATPAGSRPEPAPPRLSRWRARAGRRARAGWQARAGRRERAPRRRAEVLCLHCGGLW